MAQTRACPSCGAALPPSGECLPCHLRAGLEQLNLADGQTQPVKSGPGVAKSSEEKIGHYKLLEQIGEGGCGVVYVAEQAQPVRRRVALKVIKLGMDTRQVIARFEAERQALALMDHPGIAKVLDAGTTEAGRPYFVMELVKGIPITRYCDEKKLKTQERLELFVRVCQAIQHAHQKGIIHRDIKPSNILVADHDGVPTPKIIDFGIAKAITDQRLTDKTVYTSIDQFIGTPGYMSPEQAQLSGLDIDTRSDIYSLGVLLYELLTGKTPFDQQRLGQSGLDEVRRIIREEDPLRPSTRISTLEASEQTAMALRRQSEFPKLVSLIRGDLDWIVMKTLEKDRNRRYETANGLALDVRRFLDHEPIVARPPTTTYRLGKFARKHRMEVAVAATISLALISTTIISSILAVWASRQKSRALFAEAQARQREQDAKAVLSFFQDKILAAARPEGEEGGLGPTVTVQRAVEAATAQISSAFSDRPIVEAAIRNTLGKTFDTLGQASRAIPELERALSLRQARLGPDHPDTLITMSELASAYRGAERLNDAIRIDTEALQLRRKSLGATDSGTIQSMIFLALDYRRARRLPEALPLHEEALKLAKAALGPDHLVTLMAMNSLASAYREAGRVNEAIPLQEETLRLRKEKLGPEHPATLLTLSDLSKSYRDSGRTNEWLKLNEEVVALRKARLGPDHPETLGSMVYLGAAYKAAGRFEDYLTVRKEIYRLRSDKFPQEHPSMREATYTLGYAYLLSGHGEEAAKRFKPLAEQGSLSAQEILGEIYRTGRGIESDDEQGRFWWGRAIEHRRGLVKRGEDVWDLNNLAWALVTCPYDQLRDGALALQYAEKAVTLSHRREPNMLDTLAAAYAETGDFEKAVTTQKEAIALLKEEVQRNSYRERLKLYQSKKPCRSPME